MDPALTIPSLPSEVYGIVAEFLAGDHAFGTLANLNTLNHDIHEETLAVLYETVLWNHIAGDMELTAYFQGGDKARPKGFRFTKFLICKNWCLSLIKLEFGQPAFVFPALRMVIAVVEMTALPTCLVHITRSLHTYTVFYTICGTPMGSSTPPVSDAPYTAARIVEISFTATGRLLSDVTPGAGMNRQMAMRLNGTAICSLGPDQVGQDHFLDTIMEIMKAVGHQERHRTVADPGFSHTSYSNGLTRACHLGMLLRQAEVTLLVDKMTDIAMATPEILFGVLKIFVHEKPTRSFQAEILLRLQSLQQEYNATAAPNWRQDTRVYSLCGVTDFVFGPREWETLECAATGADYAYQGRLAYHLDNNGSPFVIDFVGNVFRIENIDFANMIAAIP